MINRTNRNNRTYAVAILLFIWIGAFAQGPPTESGSFRAPDLVEITKLDPTIKLDIRYATRNNFLGRRVYQQARAFLQRPAAEALVRVNQSLREYDEMTERAHINYACGTAESSRLRDLLRGAMEAEGFAVYEPEWWHYDYKDWQQYPIMNVKFSKL